MWALDQTPKSATTTDGTSTSIVPYRTHASYSVLQCLLKWILRSGECSFYAGFSPDRGIAELH